MMMPIREQRTEFIVYSPAAFAHPGLALAAARAGALGVLDFQFVPESDRDRARKNRATFERLVENGRHAGMRLDRPHLPEGVPAGWTVVVALAPLEEQLAIARAHPGKRMLVEVGDVVRLEELRAAGIELDGVIACGWESGGWISPTASFILAQKMAGRGIPVLVRGASGPRAIAACRVAGCQGAVLSGELLLTADSPLSESARRVVERLNVGDTVVLGERLGMPLRIAHHGAFAPRRKLQELALHLEAIASPEGDIRRIWVDAVYGAIGWGEPSTSIWPLGSGVGFAARYAARCGSVGLLLQEWRREIDALLADAANAAPFSPGTPLAQSHGTEYPIVQGPMTRVSDNAPFARAVADGGALPMLALGLLRGEALASVLDETNRTLADNSWGAGILGFVPPEIRNEQIDAILRSRPPLALIAGGRPEQARRLESHGIPTYVHVPSPSLVAPFFDAGVRRFVFEGSESGGHVGALGAFGLWESCVDALLDAVPKDEQPNVHVLFAGGIHDERSAAMASLFSTPLARRGLRVGVLMGTAYLFSKEAVATGAIVPQYQDQAIACCRTVTLESGLGHANRCAITEFAMEFDAQRRALLHNRVSPQDMKDDLDRLGLGRLRLAAKGKVRKGAAIVSAEAASQTLGGMYMMGEVATLRDRVTTIAELHRAVSIGSTAVLASWKAAAAPAVKPVQRPSDIAIIGMATLLPGASDRESFWDNVLHARSAISEVPADRWDWRVLFDADRSAPDRSYSKWGGFFDDIVFDPLRFGIPPNFVPRIGVAQLLTLEMVDRALVDAGYDRRPFDRERVAVIVAEVDHGGILHHQHVARTVLPFMVGQKQSGILDRLAEWSEDSFPGSLSNITAGRVSNRFDFGGPNFAIDAACASSLTALDLAVQELTAGRSDMAIVGGIDTGQHPYGYVAFSKTHALSPTGQSRPFDKNADGIVISEGLAIVVLKRLTDAERDGDNIYAVVKSVAGSSDGKAMSLTAPHPAGQLRALRRAYARANILPSQIGYYEAHGTGTAIGDKAEAETINTLLLSEGAKPKQCAVGSVKALIGHTKTAAGLVSVVKTALALRHRVIPPHRIESPLEVIGAGDSPVYASKEARAWLAQPGAPPRRAGISAFGFGGTNSHAVLEEYRGHVAQPAPGAEQWPCELIVVRGATKEELITTVRKMVAELHAGARPSLRDFAFTCAVTVPAAGDWSAAFVVATLDDVAKNLAAIEAAVERNAPLPHEIVLRCGNRMGGAIALLFPGQGSQYSGMGRECALYIDEVRGAIESADAILDDTLGTRISRVIDPLEESDARLIDTAFAQPAIGVMSVALAAILRRLGIRIDMTAGHSYGEYVALQAAGALAWRDLLLLSALRGRVMRGSGDDRGTMIAVGAGVQRIELLTGGIPGIVIANCNAPEQTVLSGTREGAAAVGSVLERNGINHVALAVSGAFHSPLMEVAQEPLAAAIAETSFSPPRIPVYGNDGGQIYPADPDGIRARLSRHLLQRVDFIDVIQRMYADGARLFIESGPSNVLTQMVGQILGAQPHLAVSLDRRGGRLRDQLAAVGEIWAAGRATTVEPLFAGRHCRLLDLDGLARSTSPPRIPDHAFLVNGMWARAPGEARALGRERLRDADSPVESAEVGEINVVQGANEHPKPSSMAVYEAYQQTMRQFLKTQEETLRMFLGAQPAAFGSVSTIATLDQRPVQPIPRPQETPAVSAKHPAALPPSSGDPEQTAEIVDARRSVSATLVELLAEVTGYPTSMIDINGDLEGDLGVDSIRRLQVLQKLQRRLPPEMARMAGARAEQISRARSVGAVLDVLFGEEATAPTVAVLRAHDSEPAAPKDCPRFVIRASPRPLTAPSRAFGGTFLLTGEQSPLLPHVLTHLRNGGARALVLSDTDCGSRERLASQLTRITGAERVTGVVHLAPAVVSRIPNDYGEWRKRTQLDTKAFFYILSFAASRGLKLDWVASVSAFGGAFGRDGSTPVVVPSSGAAVGLLKSYQIEHSAAVVKALDFNLVRSPAEIAAQIVDELAGGDSHCEIGFIEGSRHVFTAVHAPLAEPLTEIPRNNWVILVTGGARGITAKVARALAAPGQIMIVVGRRRLAGEEDPSLVGLGTVDMLRQHLVEKARASGANMTPAQINRELSELLRDREIRYNLDALRSAGVEVSYVAVDVRSPGDFEKLIADIYERHGRIDAVVHGAGVIADKLLAEKSADVFEQVFDTKVDSTYLLWRHLQPQSLRLVMLFASTAGRFGNRGQSDYAAANEVMNRFAWRMSQAWPNVRVMSINWGPWSGSGMASEPLNEAFRARGVHPIDPRAGTAFALSEIASSSGDIEIIAGEGPWREETSCAAIKHAIASPMRE